MTSEAQQALLDVAHKVVRRCEDSGLRVPEWMHEVYGEAKQAIRAARACQCCGFMPQPGECPRCKGLM
jgi:hypothetical protein